MMIIMKANATPQQVENVIQQIKSEGLAVHLSQGVETTIIGAIGETHSIPTDRFEGLEGVEVVQRITQPYKLASRQFHPENTVLPLDGFTVGGDEIAIIAGSRRVSSAATAGVTIMRATVRPFGRFIASSNCGNGKWTMGNGPTKHHEASRAHFPFPIIHFRPSGLREGLQYEL